MLKQLQWLGFAASIAPSILFGSPSQRLQVGIIGTGFRGQWVTQLLLNRPDVDIPVICDIDDIMIERVLKIFEKANRPLPKIYKNGPEDFRNMVANEDLDGVYIATPWEWHHPMAVAAMENNIHVGTEVPAALTVKECWDLVNISEKTGKLCMIMENVNYRRDLMAVLNMVSSRTIWRAASLSRRISA